MSRPALLMLLAVLLAACADGPRAIASDDKQPAVDVRQLMNASEFRATGLSRLTPAELQALNAWLAKFRAGEAPDKAAALATNSPPAAIPAATPGTAPPQPAKSVDAFGRSQMENKAEPEQIVSRIDGTFDGWHGNTVFKLENGQVWVQADPTARLDVHLDHPQVTIKKMWIGYGLKVEGHGQLVFVRRIR